MEYVKKKIDAAGKKVAERIDKIPAGKKGKESLKVYWEYLATPIELDILQELHRLNIIGEDDRERYADASSERLAEIVNTFLKSFGKDPEDPNVTKFQQLKNVFKGIKKEYDEVDKTSEEALTEVIEKIDRWIEFHEEVIEELSDEEKMDLKARVEEAKKMREALLQWRGFLEADRIKIEFSTYLKNKFQTFWKTQAKFIKTAKDIGYYQDMKDRSKLVRFAKYVADQIVEDKENYDIEYKALEKEKLGSREDVLLKFIDPFLPGFEKEEEEAGTNESFVSFYDYYKNQL